MVDDEDNLRQLVREILENLGHQAETVAGGRAALARLEARVALEVLSQRIESFRVIDESRLRYAPSFILRGLESLELDVVYR